MPVIALVSGASRVLVVSVHLPAVKSISVLIVIPAVGRMCRVLVVFINTPLDEPVSVFQVFPMVPIPARGRFQPHVTAGFLVPGPMPILMREPVVVPVVTGIVTVILG